MRRAVSLAAANAGNSIAARTAIIAMTSKAQDPVGARSKAKIGLIMGIVSLVVSVVVFILLVILVGVANLVPS